MAITPPPTAGQGNPQAQYAAMLREQYRRYDEEYLPFENMAISQLTDPGERSQNLNTALGYADDEAADASGTQQQSAAILRSRYNIGMREADQNIVNRRDRESQAMAQVTSRNVARDGVDRRDNQLLFGA